MSEVEARVRSRRPAVGPGALAAVVLALLPPAASAQDSHYWNLQYGPVAELLGGVVVGSALDLSSTYYNPGGLALAEDPAFLISLDSFQLETVEVDDERDVFDLSSSRFKASPSLVAIALPGGGDETRFAASVLTRQELKVRVQRRQVRSDPGPPALRAGSDELTDQDVSETWGGLTVSHRVSERASVGATVYGVYRGQRLRTDLSAQVATGDGASGLTLLSVDDLSYDHFRALAKVGLALDLAPLRLGVAVTTPSVGLFGSGRASFTRSSTGIPIPGARGDNFLENGFAEGLSTEYRTPLSVAVGASYRFGTTRLHASAEWFDAVERFDVIDPTPFSEDEGRSLRPLLRQELASVLNAGVGAEVELGPELKLYGAFTTDFSANVHDRAVQHSLATWDIFHLTAGAGFRVGSTRFTVGVSYAFGRDEVLVGIPGVDLDLPVFGPEREAGVRYRRWKFNLGFVFGS